MAEDSKSKTTTDHATIQEWAAARGGKPVTVRGTGGNAPGVLRIDFPGGTGSERFEAISWDEWFQKFDDNELVFLYQEHKASGEISTFFKLINAPEQTLENDEASSTKGGRRVKDDNNSEEGRSTAEERSSKGGRKKKEDTNPAGDLAQMSKDELLERAKELDIAGRSGMKKQELIEAIQQASAPKEKERGK